MDKRVTDVYDIKHRKEQPHLIEVEPLAKSLEQLQAEQQPMVVDNVFRPRKGMTPEEVLREFQEKYAFRYGAPGIYLLDLYEEDKR